MVEEFKEVQTGADEVLSYDIDPEGVEEEEPKGLKRLFRGRSDGAPPPQTPEPVALEGLDMSDLSFEECADETLAREPPSHKEDMKWTDDDFAAREAPPGETAEKAQPSTTSTPRSSFTRGSVCLPRPGESEGSGLGDARVRRDVAAAGVVGTVVSLLRDASADLRRGAAGCSDAERRRAAEQGAGRRRGCLDPLVALLNDGDARVAEEAAGCLWSLAIDDRNKVAIVAAGALPRLAMLLRESGDEPTKTVEHAAGVLQNLAMLDEHQSRSTTRAACRRSSRC
ncbi:hypothetical protein JL720_15093 [Aureococcus anophagefferens]|nr:hypothetical protein JL720_15093 [Aureococcus anophagefferens]